MFRLGLDTTLGTLTEQGLDLTIGVFVLFAILNVCYICRDISIVILLFRGHRLFTSIQHGLQSHDCL